MFGMRMQRERGKETFTIKRRLGEFVASEFRSKHSKSVKFKIRFSNRKKTKENELDSSWIREMFVLVWSISSRIACFRDELCTVRLRRPFRRPSATVRRRSSRPKSSILLLFSSEIRSFVPRVDSMAVRTSVFSLESKVLWVAEVQQSHSFVFDAFLAPVEYLNIDLSRFSSRFTILPEQVFDQRWCRTVFKQSLGENDVVLCLDMISCIGSRISAV